MPRKPRDVSEGESLTTRLKNCRSGDLLRRGQKGRNIVGVHGKTVLAPGQGLTAALTRGKKEERKVNLMEEERAASAQVVWEWVKKDHPGRKKILSQ